LEPGIIKRRRERTPDKEFVSGDKANLESTRGIGGREARRE
jgi:hypothetical protein